jgi:hypothetical protein
MPHKGMTTTVPSRFGQELNLSWDSQGQNVASSATQSEGVVGCVSAGSLTSVT